MTGARTTAVATACCVATLVLAQSPVGRSLGHAAGLVDSAGYFELALAAPGVAPPPLSRSRALRLGINFDLTNRHDERRESHWVVLAGLDQGWVVLDRGSLDLDPGQTTSVRARATLRCPRAPRVRVEVALVPGTTRVARWIRCDGPS